MPARYDDGEIMVWIISAKIEVVLVCSPGIIDFMNPAVNIPDFAYMVISIISRNRYDPVSNRIIPVPVFRIHNPVIMVHTVGPGNMDPVRYPVMIIDIPVPDGIVMIAFYMIRTHYPPIGCCIMLAMLRMGPVNMLPATSVSTDRMIISLAVGITADSTIITGCCVTIVSSCCTLVRGWLLSLVCTGIVSVRGSVPPGTTSIASVATSYLALPRLFVGTFMCLAPADTGPVISMVFGRAGPAPVSMGNVSCTGLPGPCCLLALVAFLFS